MGKHKKWKKKYGRHLDRHHRVCRSLGGDNSNENISVVNVVQHQAWHILFSNHTPQTIANIINEKWIPLNVEFVVQMRMREKSHNHD